MALTSIPWSTGSWLNDPLSHETDAEGNLVVVVGAKKDFWKKTMYGFEFEDAPALLAPWDTNTSAVEVSFKLDGFAALYDQAGFLLYSASGQWIKAGIELNDGVPCLSTVVTNEYSDWSVCPVPHFTGHTVTLRASVINDGIVIRARTDAHPWQTIRVARFPYPSGTASAGPYLCAPQADSLRVTFTRWATSAKDAELHADPPHPFLAAASKH